MARLRESRAVFFDVDDTLYDFNASMRHAFEHLHRAFPDVFTGHDVDRLEASYWAHYRAMPDKAKEELINRDPDLFRITMWTGALEGLGVSGDLSVLARTLTQEFDRARPDHWRRAMYEGARDLLRDLKGRRVLGAITNGPSRVQRPKLEALAYREFFPEELVFVSGEFGRRKPDPSIFLAAAKAAGVDPAECVMVGDAREFDMPAKAVGFGTVLFLGAREEPDTSKDEHPPDAVVRTYAELRSLLGA